jgi:hypothetical protein
MSSLNCSLLIHTFNNYEWLWDGCLESWSKIDLDIPKYFGTDTPDHLNHNFKDFNLLYSGEGNWSDRLVILLNKINTDYIFYVQEDHWPYKAPPDLKAMMEIVKKHDLYRLHLAKKHRYYTVNGIFFDKKSKYLVSHQPSIWLKSFFLDCISYAEDPWLNEYEGTKRLNITDIENKIAIHPCDWFKHKCQRGKYLE